jgi:Methyltransferase domain
MSTDTFVTQPGTLVPVTASYEVHGGFWPEGPHEVNWHTMPPKKPYKIFIGFPNRGEICSASHQTAVQVSRKHKFITVPLQFGDVEHNFNTLFAEAYNNRDQHGWTHWGLLHSDIGAEPWWADILIEEMDRIGADVMSTVMAIKDDRGLTTTGIRYPGIAGARRFTMREISRLPETFSIADTDEPDQILAINTGLWICRFPVGGWPDKFADGVGFTARHKLMFNEEHKVMCEFDSEDWRFSEWAHQVGLRVFATRKVKANHHGGMPYGNQGEWGSWATEKHRPRRPLTVQIPDSQITIETGKPVAIDSLDHTQPLGARDDNSLSYAFNRKLFKLIPARNVRCLDLGCSGGAFVRSILEAGGFAIGLEGSDLPLCTRRAEWTVIPHYLFTADATSPFVVRNCTPEPVKFNVITGWEFFEHIKEEQLPAVIDNILRHATDDAIFIGSISSNVEPHHQTAKPREWWLEYLGERLGEYAQDLVDYFARDLVRGSYKEPGAMSFSVAFRITEQPPSDSRGARIVEDYSSLVLTT